MQMQEVRFGIELETVSRDRGTVARAIQSVVGGEVTHVEFNHSDISIDYHDFSSLNSPNARSLSTDLVFEVHRESNRALIEH